MPTSNPHPPGTPLILRVGVTGHRPDPKKGRPLPDVARLRETVREILKHISEAVHGVAEAHGNVFNLTGGNQEHPGYLRVVSALAEGADQWIADEALALGYDLQCPLPFAREEYEKDFEDPAAQTEYLRLLSRASTVLELDGKVESDDQGARKPSSAAYEAVGRAVLNQTDLLMAIWDGKPEQGRGGTGAVVTEALQRGIPVVWVAWPDSLVPPSPEWRILKRATNIEGNSKHLKIEVRELLLPPEETDTSKYGRATTKRAQYFEEIEKQWNAIHGWWQIFSGLVTGELLRPQKMKALLVFAPFRVEPFEKATRTEWDRECKGTLLDPDQPNQAAQALAAAVDASYFRHYAWANRLSVYYASLYRSAFVVSQLLAAAAVFFALFGTAGGFSEKERGILVGLELIAILTILGVTTWGRHRHWHERSIDYRMLAERLRLARCLALFGGGGQQVSLAAHLATYGNPVATWMHWHYQAIERAAGLVNIQFSSGYLKATQEFWRKNLIEDQIEYHEKTSIRYEKLDERVHFAGITLFALTLVACTLHLLGITEQFTGWLILAAAFLPALGAALAAIRTQAEAQRLFRRSHAMKKSLERLGREFASTSARDGEGDSQRLRAHADRVTDLMVREMLDWRVVVQDQPLETHV